MIVVRVELHSAIDGSVKELARMDICNESETRPRATYGAYVMRGRDRATLNRRSVLRECKIENYPSAAIHVWNLIASALVKMKYGFVER